MSYSIDSLAPLCKSKGGEATIKFSKNEKYPKNCWDSVCEYPLTTWQQTMHAKCYEPGSRQGAFSNVDSFAQIPECLLAALSVCICRCHVWCDTSQPAEISRLSPQLGNHALGLFAGRQWRVTPQNQSRTVSSLSLVVLFLWSNTLLFYHIIHWTDLIKSSLAPTCWAS